jgi:hypothetical protein
MSSRKQHSPSEEKLNIFPRHHSSWTAGQSVETIAEFIPWTLQARTAMNTRAMRVRKQSDVNEQVHSLVTVVAASAELNKVKHGVSTLTLP